MLPSPLYVICDWDVCARAGWTVVDFAAACLEGGARFLQIRAKQVPARELLEAADAIVGLARRSGTLVVVNDRADIARLACAGGVHVGQDDLSPSAVRGIVGNEAVVGLSTHTAEQCDAALRQPVNYVVVGPVFGTATKATGYDPIGVIEVRRAAGQIAASPFPGMPLVAIGGITMDNARSVIDAGAGAVAVIADLLATGDPADRVARFLRVLEEPIRMAGRNA